MDPEERQTEDLNLRMSRDKRDSPSQLAEPAAVLTPGTMVAERYKVLALLGRGAMGSVYRVEQVFLHRRFALKILNGLIASSNTIRRFQNEAKAANRLDHPNIAKAIDFGLIENHQPFMVMELVDGQTLAQWLKKVGHLPVPEVLEIFIPIFEGIAHAHLNGVIHRDIKPGNIMLISDASGKLIPKVVDFGIAKVELDHEVDGSALTRTGEIFGTPLYMSPEQCSGSRIDGRSDIYSLGCVLFETLAGALPFHGDSALQTMMQHRTEAIPSLKEASLGTDFGPAVELVMSQLLAKDPDERYQTCLEAAQDLNYVQQKQAHKVKPRKHRGEKLETGKAVTVKPLVILALSCVAVAVCVSAAFITVNLGLRTSPLSPNAAVHQAEPSPSSAPLESTDSGLLEGEERVTAYAHENGRLRASKTAAWNRE